MKMKIEYDEFRQDVIREDGTVIQRDVLFIRATKGNLIFHCPIWVEDEYAEGVDIIQDVKDILAITIKREEENGS